VLVLVSVNAAFKFVEREEIQISFSTEKGIAGMNEYLRTANKNS
jgi:hypothetical protein